MDKKHKVIENIKNTYCRIKSSKISGVGVFAIRDIPKGINPFKGINNQKWYKIKISELKGIDKEILRMIDDFLVIEKDKSVFVPEHALNGMDISFFLNNSKNPNVKTIDDGTTFITLKKIKKGKEVTVSYETYDYKWKK